MKIVLSISVSTFVISAQKNHLIEMVLFEYPGECLKYPNSLTLEI